MLDVTRETLKRTSKKMKKITYIVEILVQLFYMGYLVFALIFQKGIVVANSILLSLCFGYFLFYIMTLKYKYSKKEKLQRKKIKRFVKWAKIIIKIIVIGFAIIEMVLFKENRTIPASIMLAIMIITLLTTILLDLLVNAISLELDLLYGALVKDTEGIVKFINVFKKNNIELNIPDNVVDKINQIQEEVKAKKKTKKK